VGRNHKSTLVEGREGHDVAIGRCRRFLMTRHEPLHRLNSCTKETVLDKALQACASDVRAVPRIHGERGQRSKSFAGGERARVGDSSAGGREAEGTRLRLGILRMEGKAPIYSGRWSER
jgi:hypothetical protein